MGFRLSLLSMWTPNFIIRKELDKLSNVTVNALQELLREYAPYPVIKPLKGEKQAFKSLAERRSWVAKQQTHLVNALVEALGQDEAVIIGRATLFKVGQQHGIEARARLGVGSSQGDLVKAARVMYRVLGIDFTAQWHNKAEATLTINRCALAQDYSEITCMVLSATDEGVVRGLNPNMRMKFTQHITGGCKTCKAKIKTAGKNQ